MQLFTPLKGTCQETAPWSLSGEYMTIFVTENRSYICERKERMQTLSSSAKFLTSFRSVSAQLSSFVLQIKYILFNMAKLKTQGRGVCIYTFNTAVDLQPSFSCLFCTQSMSPSGLFFLEKTSDTECYLKKILSIARYLWCLGVSKDL